MSKTQHTDEEKLASLLVRWEEAWDLGEDIPASDLCADCPELIGKLQQQIDVLKRMAWMKKDAAEEEPESGFDEPDPLVGQTLAGRYHIERLIGEGGFGRVYRAFDPELDRHVAVKVSKPGRTPSPEQTNALLEEARRAAKLRHPGIVSVHDVGRHDERVFFVTDLIEGRSLAEMIAQDRPAPVDAVRLIAEIADALQFAHDQGFVHRDIKPANILVDQKGRPLIADFGIAASIEEIADGEAATSGTLPYMSPEQVAGEIQLIDARTDVHALGVVLYELLTSRLPYQARTPTAQREQIVLRQPKPPRSINPGVPKQVEQVCLRALAKHPADRFASAEEMASALRSCLTVKAKVSSWKWLIVAGLVAALALAALIFGPRLIDRFSVRSEPNAETVEGVLAFDGSSRIVTPLERFAPATLEAWIRPSRYEDRCHYVIGSDVPSEWGISVGVCGVMLSAERIEGLVKSKQVVPVGEWSHIAAVFGETETRLYFNGKLVHTGPPTEVSGGTRFVIGNAGENHPREFFLGQIRSLRISTGERYNGDFVPEEEFAKNAENAPVRAVLIYDGSAVEKDRVLDLSESGNSGRWERLGP